MQLNDISLSTPMEATDKFADCTCDITAGGCDFHCCCDPDCPSSLVRFWSTQEGVCKLENQNPTLKECAADVNQKRIDDIQMGLRFFTKFGHTLMCSAKVGEIKDTNYFSMPITSPTTPEEAD